MLQQSDLGLSIFLAILHGLETLGIRGLIDIPVVHH